jgi:ketosteroid isomerase-like protein
MLIVTAAIASAEDAMKIIQAQAKGFDRATMAKDIGWFEKAAAPDYHDIDKSGHRMDRKAALAMMKQMFQMSETKSISTRVLSAKQKGNTILCMCETKMAMTMKMSPKAKKPSLMKSTMKYRQLWKKIGSDWKVSEIKMISDSTTVDGKPYKGGM